MNLNLQVTQPSHNVVLTTMNSRYSHSSFGLRYLKAQLPRELADQTHILEGTISQSPIQLAEKILSYQPKVVGIGIYIWNVELSKLLIQVLKRLRPDLVVIVGGPEVSYELASMPWLEEVDHTVTQEGDLALLELLQHYLEQPKNPKPHQWIQGGRPEISKLQFPYHLYSDEDIAQRRIYVEASRGCPFRCEFCLSSLDKTVRDFPIESFIKELNQLYQRGAKSFKFVDRTFNLKASHCEKILNFFLSLNDPQLHLHFEMIPDRLPDIVAQKLALFPAGVVQLEIGIQTFNADVMKCIQRKQNYQKIETNLNYLLENTFCHLHVDLIAGLPNEDLESFQKGFDRLWQLGPHEIQLGILKRLRGTPIADKEKEYQLTFSPQAPYEVLQTGAMSFSQLQNLKHFSQLWDRYANRGRLTNTLTRWFQESSSTFEEFWNFTLWFRQHHGSTHSIGFGRQQRVLLEYLTPRFTQETVSQWITEDLQKVRPSKDTGHQRQHSHVPSC